ncbi:MAG: acetyl/propionyl-CoA carboxylase subunit alpha, partial [Sphingomonas bacterium]|uniref:ATP-binding protein n=1 Tax=Sphingomonas bacterium TaxID=1895847 RepID=UPI00262D29B7
RRHQKVVEEAPSPFVTPKMRKAMGEQAVALAKAVGYYSAGTVELIVSGADTTGESFYFLEMNTRLQVEHPVTEAVTGLDLVEQMIRVAAGEKLAFGQDDVTLNGWAVENRVYAEDPYRGFLPSTGRLVRYRPPAAEARQEPLLRGASTALGTNGEGDAEPPFVPSEVEGQLSGYTRVDDGVVEGGEVSIFYDPMIAKLITWAPTREAAIDAQVAALDRFEIAGVGNNVDFLSALMQHPRFREGAITTGFIAEEYPDGFTGAPAAPELIRTLAAVAAFAATAQADRSRRVDGQLGKRLRPPAEWVVRIGERDHQVLLDRDTVLVDAEPLDLAMEYTPGDRLVEVEVAGEPLAIRVAKTRTGLRLTTRGASHMARVLPAHVAAYAHHLLEKVPPDLSRFLLAPMPGLLVRLAVAEGDKVEAGQPLAVVEAMKMENILRAGKTGRVKAVEAKQGDSLAVDQVILELE